MCAIYENTRQLRFEVQINLSDFHFFNDNRVFQRCMVPYDIHGNGSHLSRLCSHYHCGSAHSIGLVTILIAIKF